MEATLINNNLTERQGKIVFEYAKDKYPDLNSALLMTKGDNTGAVNYMRELKDQMLDQSTISNRQRQTMIDLLGQNN